MAKPIGQSSPHRYLSDDESRVYFAGMQAAKRGEKYPSQPMSEREMYIWRLGWRRSHNVLTAKKPKNKVQSYDGLICTHFQNFDAALDEIKKRQICSNRGGGKLTIRKLLASSKSGQKTQPYKKKHPVTLPQLRFMQGEKVDESAATADDRRRAMLSRRELADMERDAKSLARIIKRVEKGLKP